MTLLTSLSALAFIIQGNYLEKLGIVAGVLLAIVFMHVSTVDQLPALDYLTIYDKMMVTYYSIIIIPLFSVALQMRYEKTASPRHAEQLNKLTKALLPVFGLAMYALLTLSLRGTKRGHLHHKHHPSPCVKQLAAPQ